MAETEAKFPTEFPGGTHGIEDTHDRVEVTPFGNRTLGYRVLLPKNWGAETDVGEQHTGVGLPVRIGLFADHPGEDGALVDVSYTVFPMEVGLWDWVRFHARRSNVRLARCEPMEFATGPGVDAGGYYGPEDALRVVRLTAFIDAGRIFTVMAMVPAAGYPARMRDVAFATHGFALTAPTRQMFLEQWLDAESTEEPVFHVGHPASWTSRAVTAGIHGRSGLDIVLARDKSLMGYVRVKALDTSLVRDPSPADKRRTATEELSEAGVVQHTAWAPDDDPTLPWIEGFVGSWQARGRLGETDVALRLGEVERHGLVFLVSQVGVREEDDAILWMRTRRAYGIALATAHR